MCDTAGDTPLISFKGINSNLIQINFSSENSTGDSVLSIGENSEEKRGRLRQKFAKKIHIKFPVPVNMKIIWEEKPRGEKANLKSVMLKIINIKIF